MKRLQLWIDIRLPELARFLRPSLPLWSASCPAEEAQYMICIDLQAPVYLDVGALYPEIGFNASKSVHYLLGYLPFPSLSRCCSRPEFEWNDTMIAAVEDHGIDAKRQEMAASLDLIQTNQPVIPLYQYKRISDRQIRIFTLFPAPRDNAHKLEGSLAAEPQNEPEYDESGRFIRGTGSYEALSYAWGSEEKPCTLLINGCLLDIGLNLHDALLHLRLPDRSRRLWVDAICIDQSNAEEKTGQVRVMWQIYGDATAVLVWLGQDSALEDGRKTFAFCDWAAARKSRWLDMKDTARRFPTIMDSFNAEASTTSSAIRLDHVEMFLSRSWFSRLWVVQEFKLAADIVMHCGRNTIDLHSIAWLLDHSEWHAPRPILTRRDDDQDSGTDDVSIGKGWRLLSMVNRSTDFGYQCKDPRDRVAALICAGNVNRNDFHQFSIDYDENVECNYIRFAQYMLTCLLKNSSQLELLGMAAARHPLGLIGDDSLPTWVPDWRKERSFEEAPLKARSVDVLVLLAVGYEVQVLGQAAVCLRLMASDDPSTTMKTLETLFEEQARDHRGNGCWKLRHAHIEHGDLMCFLAHHSASNRCLYATTLTLRKSQNHKDSWVLIGSGGTATLAVAEGDACLDQLRENSQCFTYTHTAIELTIV